MTTQEKTYAMKLGRRLRAVRESIHLRQSQAVKLYQYHSGKYGTGLVELERGRAGVATLLKLKCLHDIYEVSYDTLLDIGSDISSEPSEPQASFREQLSECIRKARCGLPYSLLWDGQFYIRRLREQDGFVEFSVITWNGEREVRVRRPRSLVYDFKISDFERLFHKLTVDTVELPCKYAERKYLRVEKRGVQITCRIMEGSKAFLEKTTSFPSAEWLLPSLEAYQRMGYDVELVGFME